MNGRARPEIPVIAFHALGLDRHSFEPLRRCLQDGRRLVAFDLLGHGSNGDRASECLEDHVDYATERILRAADGPVHLLGHSFGGVVAALACQRIRSDGHDVISLALLATPSSGGKLYADRSDALLLNGVEPFKQSTLARWFGETPPPQWRSNIEYASKSLSSLSATAIASAWRALATFGDFSSVTSQPGAMCIAAADDLSTPPSAMSAIVDAMSENAIGSGPALKTLPKGGHLFPLTMAPDVARMLEAHWGAVEGEALLKAGGRA
ncbi:alpha/beta fold hydrolase [Sphingopyxis sp. MG]|uniref:alpha/beta fold hydrolase n=1 Tax=Sphingopyxis sp. MG TaxID=1866325 RepID=UPI00131A1645|nr:alpha/beta fold hydrolase [Sphingopyxis sp. MG]